jgi:hypothetical protein
VKTQDDKKLDNPVWFRYQKRIKSFAVDYGSVKFYHPDYFPFGGFEKAMRLQSLSMNILRWLIVFLLLEKSRNFQIY